MTRRFDTPRWRRPLILCFTSKRALRILSLLLLFYFWITTIIINHTRADRGALTQNSPRENLAHSSNEIS